MAGLVYTDACQSAQDVMAKAESARDWRRKFFTPSVGAEPQPAPVTPPTPNEPTKAGQPEQAHQAIDAFMAEVCAELEIEPQTMLEAADSAEATSALMAVLGLCVRRLRAPLEVVREKFGVADSTLYAAISVVDSVSSAHAFTRFTCLSAVLSAFQREWEDRRAVISRCSIANIQRAVAEATEVSRRDIKSKRRYAHVVTARHVAIAIARRLTKRSFPEIGRLFDRDHSSVLHAVRRMEPTMLALEKMDGGLSVPLDELARRAVALVKEGVIAHSRKRRAAKAKDTRP